MYLGRDWKPKGLLQVTLVTVHKVSFLLNKLVDLPTCWKNSSSTHSALPKHGINQIFSKYVLLLLGVIHQVVAIFIGLAGFEMSLKWSTVFMSNSECPATAKHTYSCKVWTNGPNCCEMQTVSCNITSRPWHFLGHTSIYPFSWGIPFVFNNILKLFYIFKMFWPEQTKASGNLIDTNLTLCTSLWSLISVYWYRV